MRFRIFLLFSIGMCILNTAMAQPVRVAVAANAQFVLKKLAQEFKKKTGTTVEVISGSSGKLSTQIKNGAPYGIFLSADFDFAQDIYTEGLAVMPPKVYALGSLIVCSTIGTDVKNWKTFILNNSQGKIGIANPELAPYGKAAKETLDYYKIYQAAEGRLVFGESISQVNTYVLNGIVSMGFSTESLVYELDTPEKFKWQKIDPAAYAPIRQAAVLLKYAKSGNFAAYKKFYAYLFSSEAKAIFKKFGYQTL